MNPISIVGAGPGALDLITIRAQQRLKTADVLVWTDSLIPIQITKLVKDDCEKIKTSSLTLEEILLILIKKHNEGKKLFVYMMVTLAYMEQYQNKYVD